MENESDDSKDAPDAKAEDPRIRNLKRAVRVQVEMLPQGRHVASPPPKSYNEMVLAVIVPAAGFLALGMSGYLVRRWLDSVAAARRLTDRRLAVLVSEDPTVATFFLELRGALTEPAAAGASDPNQAAALQTSVSEPKEAPEPLEKFYASVPGQIARLRRLFSDISRANDEQARKNTLLEFFDQISVLKGLCSQLPELRPAWLMAYALEGFVKQLSSNTSEVTDSVLGTVAGAVDLLETLCVHGVNPDLATKPPVKLLAVDDDPVSRLAISFALKKAFNAPDLAPSGEAALALAAQHTYDVIFLDVDMPGMDGFELCTKIHQTANHRTTPIIFVTRHSDFNYRAKSALSGGEDLIGKPFLVFEITVKALTLALRARLQNEAVAARSVSEKALNETASVTTATTSSVPAPAEEPAARTAGQNSQSTSTATLFHPNGRSLPALIKGYERVLGEAFFTRAPARIEELARRLQAIRHAATPADLQEFLGELYLGVHSLSLEAEHAELRTASRLIFALRGMLKKLLKHTKLCTPSALDAAGAALQLLGELCDRPGANPDLARPPVRILVVDDDPVALRAISGSIQLVFGRPDHAESGEAALALTAEKRFDLIFLDVLMPGIDGVETCKRIHETALNRRTQVVFVTNHDNAEARSKADVAGGSGFIPKPVLPSQIMLIALTFLLRARLGKSDLPSALEQSADLKMV